MLFKLSLKNIKKSIKDYGIYFFTLVFAVSLFYMFNSIDAQSTMINLSKSKADVIEALVEILNYASIFVSVILAFLIVYSNNFLIRRRKKEIGLYEVLGMSKRKVSLILFIETMLVGIISLIVGLVIGILLSQVLSIFVAKLFEANLSSFSFVFSSSAFNKTILYFGIIFFLVILFNVITLNRFKLIDLLYADKKNEKVKIRNKYVTIISFLLSVGSLGYAYYLLLYKNALVTMDNTFLYMIISGALGTFLLFFSLSGFLLKILEGNKKLYYKGLNIFTLKQVNSKINTTVISTSIICLMLLLTIGLLSGSMSLASIFNEGFKENNLTDYTVMAANYESYEDKDGKLVEIFNSFDKFDKVTKLKEFENYSKEYSYIHKYSYEGFVFGDLITEEQKIELKKEYGTALALNYNVPMISESEFNSLMKLFDKDTIDIKNNEYLLTSNIDFIRDSFIPFYESKKPLSINGYSLVPATDEIIVTAFENSTSAGNDGIMVVSDEVLKGLECQYISIVGNFVDTDNLEKMEDDFENYLSHNSGIGFQYRTRTSMSASSLGIKAMAIFLGLYLGVTFAISSATVLAIGQLSESSDNKKRYKTLNQIGADEKMINKALFTQIGITFVFPLAVALIHAYFGLKKLNALLISIGSIDLTSNILLTTLFMVVVYGGYFYITYLCSKRLIKE